MKKLSIIILVLAVLTAVAGCGSAATTTAATTTAATTTTATTTTAATTAPTTAGTTQPTTTPTTAPTTQPSQTTTPTTTVEPTPTTVVHPVYQDTIEIEGMEETVNYRLTEGRYDYAMPMDIDRFLFREGEEADFFRSIANDLVFLTVTYIEDTDNQTETAIRTNVAEGITATASTGKLGEHDAAIVHVTYGDQPDSKVMDFFLIEDDGGVYEINLVYTIATAEGFGARMSAMAEGFVIR